MKTKEYKIMANAQCAIGVHNGPLTQHANSEIKAHTLVCFDADANHVKTCSEADIPWGIAQKDASKEQSLISILPLSCSAQTVCLKLEGNVKAGQYLCLANNGLVKALPTTAGIYTVVGIALSEGANDEYIEALTTLPYKLEIK